MYDTFLSFNFDNVVATVRTNTQLARIDAISREYAYNLKCGKCRSLFQRYS